MSDSVRKSAEQLLLNFRDFFVQLGRETWADEDIIAFTDDELFTVLDCYVQAANDLKLATETLLDRFSDSKLFIL